MSRKIRARSKQITCARRKLRCARLISAMPAKEGAQVTKTKTRCTTAPSVCFTKLHGSQLQRTAQHEGSTQYVVGHIVADAIGLVLFVTSAPDVFVSDLPRICCTSYNCYPASGHGTIQEVAKPTERRHGRQRRALMRCRPARRMR